MRSGCVALLLLLAACEADPIGIVPDSGSDGGEIRFRLDSGVLSDSGLFPDAAAADAAPGDAAIEDGGTEDAGVSPDGGTPCELALPGAADRDRVLVVGQPFTANPSVDGTEIRSLTLASSGALIDDGMRLSVGFRPIRIEFTPNGQYALVLGENGELASVLVAGVQAMSVVDTISLPAAGYGDLHFWEDGRTVFVVGFDVAASSGISTVELGCDGSLTERPSEFFNVRLSASLAFLPGGSRAILLGGQTAFAPIDEDDVRLLSYTSRVGWTQLDAFDVFTDFVDALRIAVSPDGSTLLIPNGFPFSNDGNEVSVVSISGNALTETGRLMNLEDAREALFSTDGSTALVSLLTPGQVAVLADEGAGFVEVDRLSGIGLAEGMAAVRRGPLTDWVFVTSTDGNGQPNVAIVRIAGPGSATVVGMTDLGVDSENIPVGIALQP